MPAQLKLLLPSTSVPVVEKTTEPVVEETESEPQRPDLDASSSAMRLVKFHKLVCVVSLCLKIVSNTQMQICISIYTHVHAHIWSLPLQEPRNRTQLDLSFLPCLERFEQMKQCFYADSVQSKQPTFPYYRNPLPQTPIRPSTYPSSNSPGVYTNQFGIQRYDAPAASHPAEIKPLRPLSVSPL